MPARGKGRRHTQAPCRSLATYRHRHTRSWSDAAALGGSGGLGGEPHGQGGAIVKRQLTRHMRSATRRSQTVVVPTACIDFYNSRRARVCVCVCQWVWNPTHGHAHVHTHAHALHPRQSHAPTTSDTQPTLNVAHTHTRTALHSLAPNLQRSPSGASDSAATAGVSPRRQASGWAPLRLTSRPPPPPHHAGGPCSGRRSTAPAAATTPATGACGPAPPARPARGRGWR